MSFTFCPATVVAAPVETVWALLSDPATYDEWWDARTQRIVPEGNATPGQMVYATTAGFGRTWDVTLRVVDVNPERRRIKLHVALPLGIVNDNTITCTALDAVSCRVEFG